MLTGICFKGIHSDDMGVIVRTKSRLMLPEEKRRTVDGDTIDGVLDFSQTSGHTYYRERVFQSEILVTAEDVYGLQKAISRVASWLMGRGNLVYDDMPWVVWHARVISGVDFAPQIYGVQAVLTVSFQVDTWSEGKYDSEYLNDIPLDADIPLDSDIQLDMSEFFTFSLSAGNNALTLHNLGTAYVKPVFRFSGNSSSLTITCSGNTLGYSQPFSSLAIDCETQTITDGSTVMTKYASGNFPELAPGENSAVVRVSDPVSMLLVYRPKFIYNDTIIEKE